MHLTSADKRAIQEGFKFVVIRGGARACYTTTKAEAKRECGKSGRVVALTAMRYSTQNPTARMVGFQRNPGKQTRFYLFDGMHSTVALGKFATRQAALAKAKAVVARDPELRGMMLASENDLIEAALVQEGIVMPSSKRRNPSASMVGFQRNPKRKSRY